MGRKVNKYGKNEKCSSAEKESLIPESEKQPVSTNNLDVPPAAKKKMPERKKSAWAPVATATAFEDVPVFTICPYCSSKVVTKTQFKRGKKHW